MTDLIRTALLKGSIGFADLFDDLTNSSMQNKYPPHNIREVSKNVFEIELAVAGFKKDDISINVEDGFLYVSGAVKKEELDSEKYLYKGISNRSFRQCFKLSENIIVKSAKMENGLLIIQTERVVPENKKATSIEIE